MNRPNPILLPAITIALLAMNAGGFAQNDRESLVNPAPGGSQGIIGGRPGSSAGRTPRKQGGNHARFGTSDPGNFRTPPPRLERRVPSSLPVPQNRTLSDAVTSYIGDDSGLTLDESIELVSHYNLDILQNREELPQAEADYITAGLRSNPIAYIDTQGVPYGKYTSETTGGPTQYDFNIIYPLDLSRKRQARMASALLSKRAVETKFEDVVRLAIDTLYTAYTDALLAQRNADFHDRQSKETETDDATTVEFDDAQETYNAAFESLALLLNVDLGQLKQRGLYGRIAFEGNEEPAIPTGDELVSEALACRPDLISQRILICRAAADISVVRTSRFDDAQLLVQPLTYYSGISPTAPKSSASWAIGLTIPLPIYNRQQGNILKAQSIATQMRLQTASLEKTIETEVRRAVRRYQLTLKGVGKIAAEKQRRDTDNSIERLKERFGDEGNQPDKDLLQLVNRVEDFLSEKELDQHRKNDEMVIQHRRSMLKLNTALGRRILP